MTIVTLIARTSVASGVAIGLVAAAPVAAQTATPSPSEGLLTPENHTLILIDHQPQMDFAANSIPTEQRSDKVQCTLRRGIIVASTAAPTQNALVCETARSRSST